MPNIGATLEKLVARIRAKFPYAPLLIWIYVGLQAIWQTWTIGGEMIDAYSHAQFFATHADQIATVVKSTVHAIFSPIGSMVTLVFGLSYLALDRRVARLGTIPTHEQPTAIIPDSDALPKTDTKKANSLEPPFQIESVASDMKAVFQQPYGGFRVVSPDKNPFTHVAWVIGFRNRITYAPFIVRTRLVFKTRGRDGLEVTRRSVVNAAWLEAAKSEIEINANETRYLILAVASIKNPAEWMSVEDHRSTVHAVLGIELKPLPLAQLTVEATLVLGDGKEKTFNFAANLKTLRGVAE